MVCRSTKPFCCSLQARPPLPAFVWLFRLLLGRLPGAGSQASNGTRSFCSRCGTPLSFQRGDLPEELDITLSSLDETDWKPQMHIWQCNGAQPACCAAGRPCWLCGDAARCAGMLRQHAGLGRRCAPRELQAGNAALTRPSPVARSGQILQSAGAAGVEATAAACGRPRHAA